jgi:hypothetical protein
MTDYPREQLQALQKVLQDSYNFSVRSKRINTQALPQIQAMKHVVDFVYEEDQARRLLVIYYAGHGRVGNNGQLMLAGSLAQMASIDWTRVEITLEKTEADVLVIFDCCCAGILHRRPPELRGRSTRRFLYVAACRAEQRTLSAGPASFTSAMIWALEKLAVDESGFSVRRLVRTLMSYEHFPRDAQEAVVFESRFGAVDGDIWLAPSLGKGDAARTEVDDSSEGMKATADVLDLRFHFADIVTGSVVEDTALALKTFLRTEKGLRCHRVSFLKHKSYVEGPARHWLNLIRRKEA